MATLKPEWDPRSPDVLADQERAYDTLRERCPVAHSEFLGWSVFKHADVVRVLEAHETFSNVVSSHRSVPNGMDPPEHTAYRAAIEPFFSKERLDAFAPKCRALVNASLDGLPTDEEFDLVERFALPFAAACQCAFLGWPLELTSPILSWSQSSQTATLDADRERLSALAAEFEATVKTLLERRRAEPSLASDVTSTLMRTRVNGALLSDAELTSILRNWTVGEVGSMATALSTVVHGLALEPGLQTHLRDTPSLVPAAIEEILRVSGPLVSNRRVATRDTELGGQTIRAGERVTLMWVAANRDEDAFQRGRELLLERDRTNSLLYGAGIHVCPGAPLARLELRSAVELLLQRVSRFRLGTTTEARRAVYPAHGWARLPVVFC